MVRRLLQQTPPRSLKPHQAPFLDGREVVRGCMQSNTRQQHPKLDVLQIRSNAHDILSCQIVAALPQHVDQCLCRIVTVDDQRVASVGGGEMLGNECAELPESGVVLPFRIVRILKVAAEMMP